MQKSRPLWEGGGSGTACHLRTCLRLLGLGPVSATGPGMRPLGWAQGRRPPPWRKALQQRRWREGRLRGRVTWSPLCLSPPPLRSARARGNSRAAATARRLSYSASSWTRRQTANQGAYARPGNARPRLLLWGGGVPALEAVSSSCGVPPGGQESRRP